MLCGSKSAGRVQDGSVIAIWRLTDYSEATHYDGAAVVAKRACLRLACYFLSSRSAATNTKKTTEMTPFMVKKAALSLLRSSEETSECS